MNKLNYKIIAYTLLIGGVITILFSYIMGQQFATALFPTIALLSAFILTGFLVGYLSHGVTFLEPGIGAILLSFALYFIIPALNIRSFEGVWVSDWIIIFLNGILFTFVGAWLGEKFQDSNLSADHLISDSFDWSWMIAGTLMGIASSMIVVNLLDLILGHNPDYFIIPYFFSIFVTGLIVGWKSPGYTVIEAGLAGLLTITIVLNIARLTLLTDSEMGIWYVVLGIILGFFIAVLGGFAGEKIQGTRAK